MFHILHLFFNTSQYEVLTRQVIPPKAVSGADDIYTYALPMMAKLEREIPGMKLRLMGLRCTNLVSTKKGGIDFFGTGELSKIESRTTPSASKGVTEDGEDEWEVWPEGEFEEEARLEREDEMNELEQLSQELQDPEAESTDATPIRSKRKALDSLDAEKTHLQQHSSWSCPICGRSQPGNDDKAFNAHIDYCLSRQTIKEAVRATSPPAPAPASAPPTSSSSTSILSPPRPLSLRPESKRRGRGRPKKRKSVEGESEGKRQLLLFGK